MSPILGGGGAWRRVYVTVLNALSSVLDGFTRTDNGSSLGLADNTQAPIGNWANLRGSWGISSNKASTATAASSYPLATLTFTATDVTVQADGIGPGAGTAFWVTDSGNWWGTYLDGVQACQTCSNTANCISYSACCITGTYTAGTGYTCCVTGTYTAGTGYSCCISASTTPGTAYSCCTSPVFTPGSSYTCTVFTGNVFAGYGLVPSGTPYTSQGGTGNAAPCSSCGGCPTGYVCRNLGQTAGYGPGTCYNTDSYVCNATGTCYNADSYVCNATGTCYNANSFVCNANGTCYNANSFVCNANGFCCTGGTNAVTYYNCNCVTNQKIKLIQSVANSVSTIITWAVTGTVVGIKTLLSGSNVTVRAYTGASWTTQVVEGDLVQTGVSAVKTKVHGILVAPATYSTAQTSVVDTFGVS